MRRKLYAISLVITLTALAMTISDIALAYPSKGSDCSQCHKSNPTPPPPSNIASVQGDWDMTISEKTKVKIKGEKADSTTETYNDVFSFESNNEFYMLGKYFGTWQQVGKTYIVNIDSQAFSEHILGLENSEGLQSITITHSSFKAKVNKDGTIKGTIIVKAIFEADNTPGKLSLISKFKGQVRVIEKLRGMEAPAVEEQQAVEFTALTKTIIIAENYEALSSKRYLKKI